MVTRIDSDNISNFDEVTGDGGIDTQDLKNNIVNYDKLKIENKEAVQSGSILVVEMPSPTVENPEPEPILVFTKGNDITVDVVNLHQLSDVDSASTISPAIGDSLVFDGNAWAATPSAGVLMNDLNDVSIAGPLGDRSVLMFSTVLSAWHDVELGNVAYSSEYGDLINTPSIPRNIDFDLVGLSDVADVSVPNSFLKWSSDGSTVEYVTTIDSAVVTGLSTIAYSGSATLGNLENTNNTLDSAALGEYMFFDGTVWNKKLPQYSDLQGTPDIPVNDDFAFTELSDVNGTPIANGFLKWDETGTTVGYVTTISTDDVTGLSQIALTGDYGDLTNVPSEYTPISHIHEIVDVNGLPTALDNKLDKTASIEYSKLLNVPTEYTPIAHGHDAGQISGLANIATTGNYSDLIGAPSNNTYGFTGLSDTSDTPVPNAFAKWDATGSTIVYDAFIDVLAILGLADVAISNDYNDLDNKPVIPANSEFTLASLSDTATTPVPNGFLKWDETGQAVTYITQISSSDVTGLAQIATTGAINDLNEVNTASPVANQALMFNGSTWTNRAISYDDLGNTPSIVSTFIDLNDTNNLPVSNGFLKWNPAGDQIQYVTTIDTSVISGLATVASTGDYADLVNIPEDYKPENHAHSVDEVTGLQDELDGKMDKLANVDYGQLVNLPLEYTPSAHDHSVANIVDFPAIPSNGDFTFFGLSDTNGVSVPNSFVVVSGDGLSLDYAASIDTSAIAGLSTVATTGQYSDILGTPDIPTTLDDLDVNYTSIVDGNILTWDSLNSEWINSVNSIANLSSVSLANETSDEVLQYNGTEWVNASLAQVAMTGDYIDLVNTPNIITDIVGLSDVSDTPIANGFLQWNSAGQEVLFVDSISSDVISGLALIATTGDYNDLVNAPSLSTVAYTGSFNDLSDTPYIPLNNDFSFANLLDVSVPSIADGFLRWNSTADTIEYTPSINVSDINGLSTVATNGELASINDVDFADGVNVGDVLTYDDGLWKSNKVDYSNIINVPVMPVNSDFAFKELSDTSNDTVPNSYIKWDATGTNVEYATTIEVADITGLSPVATSSDYSDLVNTPDIPTNADFTLQSLADTLPLYVANGYLRWNETGAVVYETTIDVDSINGLSPVATSGDYIDLANTPDLVTSLGELTDVETSTPSNGDHLVFNGATWVNAPLVEETHILNDATDINIVSPNESDVLTYEGGTWYNRKVNYNNLTNIPVFEAIATTGNYSDLYGTPNLAPVALSSDYADLTNTPTMPINQDFSIVGLSDTSPDIVPSGILRWNDIGTEVSYVTEIESDILVGLSDVAHDGKLGTLDNVTIDVDASNNHVLRYIDGEWVNGSLDYTEITNTPAESSTIVGLSDTDTIEDHDLRINKYLRWNTDGSTVIYESTISAMNVSGLSLVATTGVIDDLYDVDTMSIPKNDKNVLTWSESLEKWIPLPAQGGDGGVAPTLLSDLADVTITDVSAGQVLVSNGVIWENTDIDYNNIINTPDTVSYFTQLLDTDPIPKPAGYVRWDNAGSLLEYVDIQADEVVGLSPVATSGLYSDLILAPTIPEKLNDLTDVISSGASNGQTLVFRSGNWIPEDVAQGGGDGGVDLLADLNDVRLTSLEADHILVYDGIGEWINLELSYALLSDTPDIPSNGDLTFIGLGDTSDTPIANGYVRWNSTGTGLVYVDSIDANDIDGLAAVAYSGDYTDLLNAPPHVSSITDLTDVPSFKEPGKFLRWNDSGTDIEYIDISSDDISGLADVARSGDYNDLINTPDLSSISSSFILLDDTDDNAVPNGYLRWDTLGDTVVYVESIDAADITGLAPVATTGEYSDLSNLPTLVELITELGDVDDTPINNGFLRWSPDSSGVIYQEQINTTDILGLAEVATSGSYDDLIDAPTIKWTILNTDTDLAIGDKVLVNTTNGEVVLTLPATPAENDVVKIGDYIGTFDQNKCTVSSGVLPIMGNSLDLIITNKNAIVELTYINSSFGWKITDGIGEIVNGVNSSYWVVANTQYDMSTSPVNVMMDTTDSVLTINLASDPYPGMTARIGDYKGTFSTKSCMIGNNGKLIMGQQAPLTLNKNNNVVELTYIDDTVGWTITSDVTYGQESVDNWTITNVDYTMIGQEEIMVDTLNAPVTITLPVSPVIGHTVKLGDFRGTFEKNKCVVDPSDNKLMGVEGDILVITTSNAVVELVYISNEFGWKVTNGIGELAYPIFHKNMVIHVDPVNGNDTTGNGSEVAPYKTVSMANSVLSTKILLANVTVTIDVKPGTLSSTIPMNLEYPNVGNAVISGAPFTTTTTITSITNVNGATNGYVVELAVNDASGFSVGDYVKLDNTASSSGNHEVMLGTWIVNNVVDNAITLEVTNKSVSMNIIPGFTGTLYKFDTIVEFNGCDGIKTVINNVGSINNVVIVGDGTPSTNGVVIGESPGSVNGGVGGLTLGQHTSIIGFGGHGAIVSSGSLLNAPQAHFCSNGGDGVNSNHGATVDVSSAIITGNDGNGINALHGATVSSVGTTIAGNMSGIAVYNNGTVNATDAIVKNNVGEGILLEYNGSVFADGIDIDNTNNSGSTTVLAKGAGMIKIADDALLTFSPAYGTVGNGAAYIGE